MLQGVQTALSNNWQRGIAWEQRTMAEKQKANLKPWERESSQMSSVAGEASGSGCSEPHTGPVLHILLQA